MGMCAGAPPGREPLLAAGADALDRPQLAFPQPTFLLPAYVGGIYCINLEKTRSTNWSTSFTGDHKTRTRNDCVRSAHRQSPRQSATYMREHYLFIL